MRSFLMATSASAKLLQGRFAADRPFAASGTGRILRTAAATSRCRPCGIDAAFRVCAVRKTSSVGPTRVGGKPGTKRHLVTDARGTPLGVRLTGANRHDSPEMAPTLDAIPPLGTGRRGRPRRRHDKLHADKAYDAKARRQECRRRGIVPRIARKGIESSQKLGRHRWVVERTHVWFNRFRRLPIRYERRADIFEAFTSLAASLITLNQIGRFC